MSNVALTVIALVAMTTINRGNEGIFAPGQAFKCSEKDAAPLLACGAAKLASEADASAEAASATPASTDTGLNAEDVANYKALAASAEADKATALTAAQDAQAVADAEKSRADEQAARAEALQAKLDALEAAATAAPAKKK
jgi:hypothetical protein